MKKRGLYCILFTLITLFFIWIAGIICTAFAIEEISPGSWLLFNDTLYDNEKVDIDGKILAIKINPSYQVSISHNGNTIILNKYGCVNKDSYRYCIFNVSYDDYDNLFAETEVILNLPVLSIERTIEKTSMYVGELVDVRILLANNGTSTIENIIYTDEFPKEAEIYFSPNMEYYGNKTVWRGSLARGKSKELEYRFFIKNVTKFSQSANYTYYNGHNTSYGVFGKKDFTANHSMGVKVQNTSIGVGEESRINVTISNPYAVKMRAEVLVAFDYGLSPSSFPGCSKTGNNVECFVLLERGEEKVFNIKFKGEKSGRQNITSMIKKLGLEDVEVRWVYDNEKDIKSVDVKLEKLTIATNLAAPFELKESTKKQVAVEIVNPNKHAGFSNVFFKAIFGNKTAHEQEFSLQSGSSTRVSFNIDSPEVVGSEFVKLNISLAYSTDYGDQEYTENIVSLKIVDDTGISITKSFSNTSLKGNGTLIVNVTVKNNRGIDLEKVFVEDKFSSDFKIMQGLAKKNVPLKDGETLNIYSYTVIAPILDFNKEYIFETVIMSELDKHLTTYTSQEKIYVEGVYGEKPVELQNTSENSHNNETSSTSSQMENLINGSSSSRKEEKTTENSYETSKEKLQKQNGGALMLFVFYIPLCVLVILLILFFVFVKKKFIILNLPKIIIQPRMQPQSQDALAEEPSQAAQIQQEQQTMPQPEMQQETNQQTVEQPNQPGGVQSVEGAEQPTSETIGPKQEESSIAEQEPQQAAAGAEAATKKPEQEEKEPESSEPPKPN